MAKNIVICADGTWNRPTTHTNVARLFNALPGPPHNVTGTNQIGGYVHRDTGEQKAFYLEGVGTKFFHKDPFAGAVGAGLHSKVLDSYILISRNYEPGDKIFLFGFSRGAYTVRSLAGLIARIGLLSAAKAMHPDCRKLANQNWWAFKRKSAVMADDAPDTGIAHPIWLVGVWDTVGALGIPFFNGVSAMDELERKLFDFADLDLSPRVKSGLHAMAIDERRRDFVPSPWVPRTGVTQCWFPGVHSDVGGGYLSRGLGNITLDWMRTHAANLGLCIRAIPDLTPDPLADRHESAASLVWSLRSGPRAIPDNAEFHASVSTRFAGRNDYRPKALARHPQFAAYYTAAGVAEKICTTDPTAPTRRLAVDETLTTVVLSEKWWNAAGLTVEAGDMYEIRAEGKWSDASNNCNADGWVGLPLLVRFRRVPAENWFHLCMAVTTDATLELHNANFFMGLTGLGGQFDSGSVIYPIGVSKKVSISQPGAVYFFANDAPTHYGNNSGYLDVTVKRIA